MNKCERNPRPSGRGVINYKALLAAIYIALLVAWMAYSNVDSDMMGDESYLSE